MGESSSNGGLGWAWLPLLISLLMPLTFLITYVWSTLLGDVEPDFPYISSTGAYPPESCFFSQMLNVIAVMIAWTVWIRHQIILDFCHKNVTTRNLPSKSRISSYFGYAAALGPSIVGNFQSSNVGSVHLVGAFLAFGVGNIYMWFQAVMSYSLEPHVNSRAVSHVRTACAFVATCMNVMTVVFSGLHAIANRDLVYWATGPWWMYKREKWAYHVIASATEWILAFSFCAMLLTFIPEFKRVNIYGTVVELTRDRRQERKNSVTFQSTETIIDSIRL